MFNSNDTSSANEVKIGAAVSGVLKPSHASQNARLLWQYILRRKLPRAEKIRKKRIFEFGHNVIFGELAVMLHIFPKQIKVVRLRRSHCEVAYSFMHNPPLCPMYSGDRRGSCIQPCPGDKGSLIKPPKQLWRSSNFVRVWWYIDEVELQWQSLRTEFSFPFIEVYWQNTGRQTMASQIAKIAQFAGVPTPQRVLHSNRHSSGYHASKARLASIVNLSQRYLRALPAAYVANSSANSAARCPHLSKWGVGSQSR